MQRTQYQRNIGTSPEFFQVFPLVVCKPIAQLSNQLSCWCPSGKTCNIKKGAMKGDGVGIGRLHNEIIFCQTQMFIQEVERLGNQYLIAPITFLSRRSQGQVPQRWLHCQSITRGKKKNRQKQVCDVFVWRCVSLQKQPYLRWEAVWHGRAVGSRPTCSQKKQDGGVHLARELFTLNRRRLLVYDVGHVVGTLR